MAEGGGVGAKRPATSARKRAGVRVVRLQPESRDIPSMVIYSSSAVTRHSFYGNLPVVVVVAAEQRRPLVRLRRRRRPQPRTSFLPRTVSTGGGRCASHISQTDASAALTNVHRSQLHGCAASPSSSSAGGAAASAAERRPQRAQIARRRRRRRRGDGDADDDARAAGGGDVDLDLELRGPRRLRAHGRVAKGLAQGVRRARALALDAQQRAVATASPAARRRRRCAPRSFSTARR